MYSNTLLSSKHYLGSFWNMNIYIWKIILISVLILYFIECLNYVELCTYKRNFEVLGYNPTTCECVLIWRQGLCRYNQVKLRPLGWALIQYEGCYYKKMPCEVIKTDGGHQVTTGRDWSDIAASQVMPRM